MLYSNIFETHSRGYLAWAEQYDKIFQSEILALKKMLPTLGNGLIVDIGVGQYAVPLDVRTGTESSPDLRSIAYKRGLRVYDSTMENLPMENNRFDYVLMLLHVSTPYDLNKAIKEAKRVLRINGSVIVAFMDELVEHKLSADRKHNFSFYYPGVKTYGVRYISDLLKDNGFHNFSFAQSILYSLDKGYEVECPRDSYGDGVFVVLRANR